MHDNVQTQTHTYCIFNVWPQMLCGCAIWGKLKRMPATAQCYHILAAVDIRPESLCAHTECITPYCAAWLLALSIVSGHAVSVARGCRSIHQSHAQDTVVVTKPYLLGASLPLAALVAFRCACTSVPD